MSTLIYPPQSAKTCAETTSTAAIRAFEKSSPTMDIHEMAHLCLDQLKVAAFLLLAILLRNYTAANSPMNDVPDPSSPAQQMPIDNSDSNLLDLSTVSI